MVSNLVYQFSCFGKESWFNFVVALFVLCLFLTVSKVGLRSVIVAFPGHTHWHFNLIHGLKNAIIDIVNENFDIQMNATRICIIYKLDKIQR